uniref:Uncharacterized protein n=1 Tax=Oryza glumipatula TaxID=40148 RepID=A0A0E0AZR6_9ORYZ
MDGRTVLEWSSLESRHSKIFAAEFNCCLQQIALTSFSFVKFVSSKQWDGKRSRSSTFKSLSDEEVVDEDDENWKWVFPDEVGNE